MTSLILAWQNAQPVIKAQIGDHAYTTWFVHLKLSALTPDHLVIITPDDFFKNWMTDNYLTIITAALREQTGRNITVEIIIEKDTPPHIKEGLTTPDTASRHHTHAHPGQKARPLNLQTRFTFNNFVVGNSNRMAYAASRAVANDPAKAYNPLFIYGQSGLGKTHLMQSIANYILETNGQTCAYVSSEQFANELIGAIQNKSTGAFRKKFRHIDVLLIDDIQFISKSPTMQEEFFHTFNDLHNNHKQIIISSDRPPKELSGIEDRLVTRFCWGLTTDIQPPDLETRVAILRKKTELEKVKVPDDIIYFIAEQIKTNIRELEGAMIRVVASSLLEEKPVSLELAKTVLKDMIQGSIKTISLEMIQQVVAEHYKVTINELKSKKRTQNIALPRQIAMYLMRKLTRHSLPEIGNAFGKDHTTVIHSYKKIEEDINNSSEIKYSIEKLSQLLNQ
ncbi:MAG: chromosomal replication initiator protein DnaA [Candidatus Omnitrophica bacterium]|nr:chromosomal replication initiator protein DnaA [Candidatus Omnitrophota bacterium]